MYHQISITKSISQIFIPSFVCVLTNKRYRIYGMGFSFCRLGHAPGVGNGGAGGIKNLICPIVPFNGHVAYQVEGGDE